MGGGNVIKGKQVLLRLVEERDLKLLVQWRNNPADRHMFFSPFLISEGGQKKWYERLLEDRSRILFMMETVEGETVGTIGLDDIDWRDQEAELGHFYIKPERRGEDLPLEATVLIIRYAFEDLNLHRLYGSFYSYNTGPMAMAEFFGFRREAVLRQAAFSGGKFYDKVILGLLREEWSSEQGGAREESAGEP
jgi:RimJ/RimL family protein N-acetyltransferase